MALHIHECRAVDIVFGVQQIDYDVIGEVFFEVILPEVC